MAEKGLDAEGVDLTGHSHPSNSSKAVEKVPDSEDEDPTENSSPSHLAERARDICEIVLSTDFGFPPGWNVGFQVRERLYGCKGTISLTDKTEVVYECFHRIRCPKDLDFFNETVTTTKELFQSFANKTWEDCSAPSSHSWFAGDTLEMEEPCDPDDIPSQLEETDSQEASQRKKN